MSLRARQPLLYLAALVAGAVLALVAPSSAGGQVPPPSVVAMDNPNRWVVNGGSGTTATIFAGGIVNFSDAEGGDPHNVNFTASEPTQCTGLPGPPTNAGWQGSCRFDTAGSFPFVCDAHSSMTGTVVVNPPPAGPPPPPAGPPPPPGGGESPGGSPTPPSSPRISVARRQTGTTLRGSVTTSGGARIVVTALVSNRALSTRRPRKVRKVKVGSQTKRPAGAGTTRFAVRLNAAARRALRRRERLAVVLRIVVTPTTGQALTRTVAVRVRAG